ncbi:MAG: hypothetical protein R3Y61_03310 [Rikenellaceae bacterium]
MKRLLHLRPLHRTIVTVAIILGFCIRTGQAQELILGVDFDTHFDNTEYTSCDLGGASHTLFTARLTPAVGIEFEGSHRVVLGAELWQDMGGNDDKFLTDIQPIMYYQYSGSEVEALAGIFDNSKLRQQYSLAIFSETYRFYSNRIMGFMGRYNSPKNEDSFVELAVNWESQYSETEREMFRVISGGEWHFSKTYLGYGFSMLHFANSAMAVGIVDNIIFNPYVGQTFGDEFIFDVRIGGYIAPQCDRILDEGWEFPGGGEITLSVKRWGVEIRNTTYLGSSLQPFYSKAGYGSLLYSGNAFYGTDSDIYNCTWIGYDQTFFNDVLWVRGGINLQCDGHGLGSEQLISLSVNFEHLFSLKK